MTSRSSQAFCTLAPTAVEPMVSIVVIRRFPIDPTGSRQERTGSPSRCTVHAPHCAMPQPNFVPVRASTSRRTQSSGISAGTSTSRGSPLIVRVIMSKPRWMKRPLGFCTSGALAQPIIQGDAIRQSNFRGPTSRTLSSAAASAEVFGHWADFHAR